MKHFAYCGRENDDDAAGCRECGTKEFIGPRDTSSVLVECQGGSPPNKDAAPNAGPATPSEEAKRLAAELKPRPERDEK